MASQNENSISLNKFISDTGICSRREANVFIKEGRVTINGKTAVLGNRVEENDTVKLNGKSLKKNPKRIYIAFNKPVGIVSTTDKKEKKNIIDYINHQKRLFPIGRLDKASQGLILLTNDGDIVNKILRAGNNHEKEYIVKVDLPINSRFATRMSKGIPILGTKTLPCEIEIIDDFTFRIILIQGLNRQIRRMCEYLGYNVIKLKRIRIMNISLEDLGKGKWRYLSPRELKNINNLLHTSSKTQG